ncbi:MAG: NAD(P)H-dependent oxidoreductase subunit E [Polyangiales bacterium]
MDLRPIATEATDDERALIDASLGPLDDRVSLRSARARRHLLLPTLHAIQGRFGWISPSALGYACQKLHVPPAEAYGVASFYALFALAERPPVVAHVCDDVACLAAGAEDLCHALERSVGHHGAPSHDDPATTWHRSPCLGMCEQAPAAMLVSAGESPFERSFGHATEASVRAALRTRHVAIPERAPTPQTDRSAVRLLARVGEVDPQSLDAYRAHGGYAALRRAFEVGAAWVMRELDESGLSGRGGAAFPAGRKWMAVAKAAGRVKHVVCNADESEPGTFKDRALLEGDPFALVEAMTLAGVTVGAEKGWIYLRGEYPLARERLANAIAQARSMGLLGDDVMGRGARFDIDLRIGAGAYICGEETALLNSIEGYRGEPRTKPPFPVDEGLFGQPTLIHNVETLLNVPVIVREGAAAYRALGTKGSPGTRLFCVSACARRACTSCPSASRSARSSRPRAGSARAARCRRSCSAAPRAPSSRPSTSTCRSPSKTRARAARRWARAWCSCSTIRSPSAPCSRASRASSARSRAASARPVAWAPCASTSSSSASRAPIDARSETQTSRCCESSPRACATRRSAASDRPRRAPWSPPS